MPGHSNHQATVVAPVCRPPLLAVGHQGSQIFLQREHIKQLHFRTIVKFLSEWAGFCIMLVENIQVE
ncbi:hypothetical protein D3C80_1360270 [compost metagenome]